MARTENEKKWDEKYKQLKEFYKTYGHSRVPYRSTMYPGLGKWVSKQRMNQHKLSKRKINKLNKLDFVWSSLLRKENHQYWFRMYGKLKRFQKEHGHCNVPSKYEPEKKLGRWVEVQRLYKDKMESWKKQKLEALGFEWSDKKWDNKVNHWHEMYERLRRFYERFGHSRVPEYWEEDPELSLWVISQRRPKKPLPPEKRNLLKELDFSWNNEAPKRKRDHKGRFISEAS